MDTRTYKVMVETIAKDLADELLIEFYHDKLGQITSCKTAEKENGSYSMSQAGARELGLDSKWVMRGKVSSCPKKKGDLPKLKTPFGLNTSTKGKQGGRIKMPTGKSKSPTYSVSDYPNKYKKISELLGEDFLISLDETFGDFIQKRIKQGNFKSSAKGRK